MRKATITISSIKLDVLLPDDIDLSNTDNVNKIISKLDVKASSCDTKFLQITGKIQFSIKVE